MSNLAPPLFVGGRPTDYGAPMTELALTDGGIETVLLFREGFELPCFASFPLLEEERCRFALRRYF